MITDPLLKREDYVVSADMCSSTKRRQHKPIMVEAHILLKQPNTI